jgi:hypothetical protein
MTRKTCFFFGYKEDMSDENCYFAPDKFSV